jgi:hypothetical protein
MTEPTTPTGRRLAGVTYVWEFVRDDVLAVEAEARQQERERLRAAFHDLIADTGGWYYRGTSERNDAMHEAMALLADPEGTP